MNKRPEPFEFYWSNGAKQLRRFKAVRPEDVDLAVAELVKAGADADPVFILAPPPKVSRD